MRKCFILLPTPTSVVQVNTFDEKKVILFSLTH